MLVQYPTRVMSSKPIWQPDSPAPFATAVLHWLCKAGMLPRVAQQAASLVQTGPRAPLPLLVSRAAPLSAGSGELQVAEGGV